MHFASCILKPCSVCVSGGTVVKPGEGRVFVLVKGFVVHPM